MRRLLVVLGAVLLAVGYVAWPFWTAWSIHRAIKTGDSATLESAVDWPSVRESLKPTIRSAIAGEPGAPDDQGFWGTVTSAAGAWTADALVNQIATPQGLPMLFSYGKAYRENIKGQADDAETQPLPERVRRLWSRTRRATFVSPWRFEFTLADRFTPARLYDGTLEFQGFGWKLTEIKFRTAEATPSLITPPAL